MKKSLIILAILISVAIGIYMYRDSITRIAYAPNQPVTEKVALPTGEDIEKSDIEVVAENLSIPWEMAFLPDGSILVTERPGRLLKIGADKSVINISGVAHTGEGGLLGLALHPNFSNNQLIYLYMTTRQGGGLSNRVERYQLQDTTLTGRTVIIENIPGAAFHDGGRIAFGPDEKLYITTGDAGDEPSAQDLSSLAGKILRLEDDGSIPSDNPFNTAVYSYGHRNPQGIAWDGEGNMWATEHGRSGARSGFDEINLIEAGNNYGWPTIQGDQTQTDMVRAKAHSGASTTWAPSGAAIFGDSLLFAGLRGQSLYVADIATGDISEVLAYFTQEFGRLRGVTVGPDQSLYILTNNTDGRGNPAADDDKIIRITPRLLEPAQ